MCVKQRQLVWCDDVDKAEANWLHPCVQRVLFVLLVMVFAAVVAMVTAVHTDERKMLCRKTILKNQMSHLTHVILIKTLKRTLLTSRCCFLSD